MADDQGVEDQAAGGDADLGKHIAIGAAIIVLSGILAVVMYLT
jgi:hypothetical protein